jgi:hypothetical protein
MRVDKCSQPFGVKVAGDLTGGSERHQVERRWRLLGGRVRKTYARGRLAPHFACKVAVEQQ